MHTAQRKRMAPLTLPKGYPAAANRLVSKGNGLTIMYGQSAQLVRHCPRVLSTTPRTSALSGQPKRPWLLKRTSSITRANQTGAPKARW